MSVLRRKRTSLITVRLPAVLNNRLEGAARASRRSKSEIIREALELHVSSGRKSARPGTMDLIGDLIGSLKGGPKDLSSNKKHLEGYGR